MKLECIGSISVSDRRFEVGGKIDDGNGFKRTSCTKLFKQTRADPIMNIPLYADTTTDT